MNKKMNKLFASGLVAAVMLTAPKALSETCEDGGAYVGLNAGLSFNKVKTTTGRGKAPDGLIAERRGTGAMTQAHYNAVTDNIASSHEVKKKKTAFLAEVALGYNWRLGDVMLGVEGAFGTQFGKQRLKSRRPSVLTIPNDYVAGTDHSANTNPSRNFATIKRQMYFGITPKIGYMMTSQLEGFVTFGIKIQKFKYETYKNGDAYATNPGLYDTRPNVDERRDDKPHRDMYRLNTDYVGYDKKTSKSNWKLIPKVGAGLTYNITPEVYAKLMYEFEFSRAIKLPHDGIQEVKKVKTQAHVVKLGVGYKFN